MNIRTLVHEGWHRLGLALTLAIFCAIGTLGASASAAGATTTTTSANSGAPRPRS